MRLGGKLPFTRVAVGPDDIAFLQYTGGTTGVSKGAILLHRNLVANVLQVEAWNVPIMALPPPIDRLIIVTALPLYHIFALTACFLFSVRVGGTCLLIPNPRDISGLIKELSKYKVNSFPAVNTLYNALLHHPDFGKLDWSMLKCAIGGGMAVQKSVAEAWMKATGRPDHRRLRPVRDRAGAHLQSRRHRRMERHHRIAASVDRHLDPRRGRP